MSANNYLIAIDQGTTSCRALLIDSQLNIVGVQQKEFTQIYPQSGWVEHNAHEIIDTQMEVLHSLLESQDIEIHQIAGIGITNQRETTVVWDKTTGQAIYNAIVWQDRRTAAICEELKAQGLEEYIKTNTGLVVDAYFSGTKIKWILDNVDGARAKADSGDLMFGTIDSWLIYNMTNGENHVTDYTNASRSLIYNIKEKKWDEKILDALQIPRSVLPEVQKSSSLFGHYNYKGIDIPICGVAGDQQAALFGQACFEEGSAKNTYGTGCFMLMNIGDQFVSSENGLLTTLCCNAKGDVAYALEGSIFIAGAAVQWLRDGLKIIKNSADSEAMALKAADKNDVVVVPAFAGLGAPYWNMYARGAIFGLSRGTDENEIVKATLDSLAYQTKDVLDAMIQDSGIELKSLNVDGGAVANNYLMQFQSDILQTIVNRPEVIETTAMGAAYLAGVYLGILDADTIRSNRTIEKEFRPAINKEVQIQLYNQWKKAVERTLNWIDKDV